ncbi:uncharacterized protein LOC119572385 isoform X1 [Penaeus monodon]|uniref:uncharacterized protein LOC119572385 isoform X1 n=1 Tax=Penaeus monodon TaxID=6687 RepID=UPI0018A6F322|nr:uncharacterized protein LOC119572385 isoform X1 [Penaeus monodon]XP_037775414.1 uncharacterized protein LOC119572385 isoform X1 [Penaeus monodon]XP_037775415.1 uncharacterized protein LOC119572385 isoform X1 [Penaeus monodon]
MLISKIEFDVYHIQMVFGHDTSDFYIFPDFSFGPLLVEESLPPLPEYTGNKMIQSTFLPLSVITPTASMTKEFQIVVGLPLALANLLASAEDGNCFDGLETSSSDTVIDLLYESVALLAAVQILSCPDVKHVLASYLVRDRHI